jgi:hypothetical protein
LTGARANLIAQRDALMGQQQQSAEKDRRRSFSCADKPPRRYP